MKALLSIVIALTSVAASAAIHTVTVEYKDGDTALEGYLAYEDANSLQQPGVLVVHQWMGLTDYERRRCEMLAQIGYVAFACDIYGKGVRPKNTQEAAELSGKYKNDRAEY